MHRVTRARTILIGAGVATIVVVLLIALGVLRNRDADLVWPLENGASRPHLLTFGLYVTPDPYQNPIDPPERFTGFHTALDIEVEEDEREKEIAVYAMCEGKIIYRGSVEGYGGTLVQTCLVDGETVTVLYGHLDPASLSPQMGERVGSGDRIGELGDHQSEETSFTRKHLHLGIHRGGEIDLRGYVQSEQELGAYIDPLPLLTDHARNP